MTLSRRFWLAVLLLFAVRTAYGGLVHGPLVLTRWVYARFPTAMNPVMNLPALLAVEALVTVLLVGSYTAYFGNQRPRLLAAAGFGLLFGVAVYLPQNLLNLILLEPVHLPLVLAWTGAGVVGAVISALTVRAVTGSPR
jgi:hypothetical protein